jgi:hypothetical protein
MVAAVFIARRDLASAPRDYIDFNSTSQILSMSIHS